MKTSRKIWAVLNADNEIIWTQGGSCTPAKLMIYDTEKRANMAKSRLSHYLGNAGAHVEVIYDTEL